MEKNLLKHIIHSFDSYGAKLISNLGLTKKKKTDGKSISSTSAYCSVRFWSVYEKIIVHSIDHWKKNPKPKICSSNFFLKIWNTRMFQLWITNRNTKAHAWQKKRQSLVWKIPFLLADERWKRKKSIEIENRKRNEIGY